MGFEPTTTGTTIRGSTAELRPPLGSHRVRRHYTRFWSGMQGFFAVGGVFFAWVVF